MERITCEYISFTRTVGCGRILCRLGVSRVVRTLVRGGVSGEKQGGGGGKKVAERTDTCTLPNISWECVGLLATQWEMLIMQVGAKWVV